jgi:hypothetical protein
MRRIRRIESRAGKVALGIGAFLLATLIVCVPVGVLGSSNIVWGEPNDNGRVDVPGTKVLHLPSGTVDASVALFIPGKGNETVDVPLPKDLSLTVVPVSGGDPATITRDLGTSGNANDNTANSQRRVWHVKIPSDGDYRVTTHGSFLGIGINAQIWFGHGPPLPGVYVPFVAMGIVILGGLIWLLFRTLRGGGPGRAREPKTAPAWEADEPRPAHHQSGPPSSVGDLERLAALHERGELTDDEFFAEKAKIIGDG